MKLDLDFIKEILESIERDCDGITPIKIEVDNESSADEKRKAYHYRLLIKCEIVDGEIHDVGSFDGQAEWISYRGLTMMGHEALDGMRNDTLWNKIKDSVLQAGVQGLKQIPALALKLLVSGIA
jgi:hypothetical protein